jgi:hypothetical protein
LCSVCLWWGVGGGGGGARPPQAVNGTATLREKSGIPWKVILA